MGGGAVRTGAQAAFPGKARPADAWEVHGRAAIHLQGGVREMRHGVLAADLDAEGQEGQGMAVRETLPAERRGGLQEREPLREGFGESLPDGVERHRGEP